MQWHPEVPKRPLPRAAKIGPLAPNATRDVPTPSVNPAPTLVLCQGLFGAYFDLADRGLGLLGIPVARYWNGVDRPLRDAGYRVVAPRVSATRGIVDRARQLKASVLREVPDGPIVLVGHSMGGLDARHLMTHLGLADRVKAVLTVATPHRGSAFADWCLTTLDRQGGLYGTLGRLGWDVRAAVDLTSDAAERFNRTTPDVEGVRYFSVTAALPTVDLPTFLQPSGKTIARFDGPNDGLVSARSAAWGTVIDHWDLDHFTQINKRFPALPEPVGRRWVDTVTMATNMLGSNNG